MSVPTTIGSYEDCFELYARAVATPKGTRALLHGYGDAKHFQMRMHQARKLQREESMRMYDATAPQYNKSEYDSLIVKVVCDTAGEYWVYIIPYGSQIAVVEDIE